MIKLFVFVFDSNTNSFIIFDSICMHTNRLDSYAYKSSIVCHESYPRKEAGKPIKRKSTRRLSNNADNWGQSDLGIYGIDADKKTRLVNWNYEVLSDLLSKLVAWRTMKRMPLRRRRSSNKSMLDAVQIAMLEFDEDSNEDEEKTVIDEVSEIIFLPSYSEQVIPVSTLIANATIILEGVKVQLHNYILHIADCYHNVPFHNLEHVSHVTLSANKLMWQNRIL